MLALTAPLAFGAPLALATPLVASTAAPFDTAMMAQMARMNDAMAAAPMTGDADRDFIAMMLPHHRGAIEMATSELAYGHDPRLRRLAQEIVVTQESETQVMRAMARDLPLTKERKR
ncbi:MAG: DUF305 domain-containing protein [Vulcanimicrobiaceae bacterium]